MKSWISFLLPDDEYKHKKVLYFYSEGAIILFLSLIAVFIGNYYFNMDTEISLLISIAIFPLYVTTRYIISGIEYTDVATAKAYRKELKVIFVRLIGFIVIFIILFMIVDGIPNGFDEWLNFVGLLLSVGFVSFITSFVSLKRSYKKNKDLS